MKLKRMLAGLLCAAILVSFCAPAAGAVSPDTASELLPQSDLDLPDHHAYLDSCGGNFSRFAGEKPRPLDKKKALHYLESRLEDPRFRLTEQEAELIGKICEKLA